MGIVYCQTQMSVFYNSTITFLGVRNNLYNFYLKLVLIYWVPRLPVPVAFMMSWEEPGQETGLLRQRRKTQEKRKQVN